LGTLCEIARPRPSLSPARASFVVWLAPPLRRLLLKDVVWNVSAFDQTTYVFVAALLIGLSFAASLLPALRLRHINAAQVLQEE
jgi:hypothetical protein